MLNRRNFVSLLGLTAVASRVSYFFPPSCGWHSGVIAHAPEWWSPEGLKRVLQNLDAHYGEIRGTNMVPLTDAMWAEARLLKARNDSVPLSDPR